MKKFFSFLGMAFLGGALTLGGYKMLFDEPVVENSSYNSIPPTIQSNYNSAFNANTISENTATIDFTIAAERTVNSVVHVKNTTIRTQQSPLDIFFGTGNGT